MDVWPTWLDSVDLGLSYLDPRWVEGGHRERPGPVIIKQHLVDDDAAAGGKGSLKKSAA